MGRQQKANHGGDRRGMRRRTIATLRHVLPRPRERRQDDTRQALHYHSWTVVETDLGVTLRRGYFPEAGSVFTRPYGMSASDNRARALAYADNLR